MKRRTFPENVKVLSWNYDFQIELAGARIGELEDISHTTNTFAHSPSFINHYPCLDPTYAYSDELSVLHLNGIAGFASKSSMHIESVFRHKIREDIVAILNMLADKPELDSHFHFSWENSSYLTKIMGYMESMVKNVTILVVIGYSFPFFNREVDKKVFGFLQQTGLRKIYYQDPVLNGQQLRAQFSLSGNIAIEHIPYVNNFYIPFEY